MLATLHTNDAASAVTRLTDMGVEPFLISASLECVLAQRLIRKICSACKTPYEPSEKILQSLGLTRDTRAWRPVGDGGGLCQVAWHGVAN